MQADCDLTVDNQVGNDGRGHQQKDDRSFGQEPQAERDENTRCQSNGCLSVRSGTAE